MIFFLGKRREKKLNKVAKKYKKKNVQKLKKKKTLPEAQRTQGIESET